MDHGLHGEEPAAGSVSIERERARRGIDVLRREPARLVPARSRLRTQDFARQEARRPTGGAAGQIRAGRQPQDRQGARPRNSPDAARPRRRGDRMMGWMAPLRHQWAKLLHRGREQLVRQRTMLVNALRAHLAEFGIVAAQGLRNVGELIAIVRDDGDTRLPDVARQVLQVLANQIEQIETAVAALERQLLAWHKTNPVSQRLASIPGIGPIIATAIATTVADPKVFRSGREFAAWLGLVPRQNSTGGKTRLGGITKRGNRYLRRLLINGTSANLLRSKATKADPWVIGLRRRRPPLVVAVALANKTARIAWAVMHRHENYQRVAAAA